MRRTEGEKERIRRWLDIKYPPEPGHYCSEEDEEDEEEEEVEDEQK